jgi:hypothetical protein
MLKYFGIFCSCFMMTTLLSAQAYPSAERGPIAVLAGVEISTFNPDYGCTNSSPFSCFDHQLIGVTPFVDANHLLFTRIGAEGEARFLPWRGPGNGLTESTYLGGPRIDLLHWRKVTLRAKVLAGDAHFTAPSRGVGTGNYFAWAPGVDADLRVTRKITARVDYEYQMWPKFTGGLGGSGGLTPSGFSVGASYAVWH